MNALPASSEGARGIQERHSFDGRGRSTIDRAMLLYGTLRSTSTATRLSALSRETGLPKSTTHRLLGALVACGMVIRSGAGYLAAEEARGFWNVENEQRRLLRQLAPFVTDLVVRTRLTASLAVLEGPDVLFVHRSYSHDNVWTPSDDTGRASAHRTAAGRLLLSHDLRLANEFAATWDLSTIETARLNKDLMWIRRHRFAVTERDGVTCLAVELPWGTGQRHVAFAVRGSSHQIDQDHALFWLRNVAHAAAKTVAGHPNDRTRALHAARPRRQPTRVVGLGDVPFSAS